MDISALLALTQGKAPALGERTDAPTDAGFTQALQAVASRHQDIASAAQDGPAVIELPAAEPNDAPLALAPLSDGIARAIDSLIGQEYSREPQAHFTIADGREPSPIAAEELLERIDAEDALALVRERMALIQEAGQPPAPIDRTLASLASGDPGTLAPRTVQAAAGGMAIDGATAQPGRRHSPAAELLLDPAEPRTVSAAVSRETPAAPAAMGDKPLSPPGAPTNVPAQALPEMRLSADADIASASGRATSPGFVDPSLTPPSSGTAIPSGASAGATNALPAASLAAPLASPPWGQQLGQQLVGLTQRGEQRLELRLNPAELGPLSVSLKMSESGAQAQFLSNHAQVRADVEQAIPQLREALEEQGISLGEAMVGEHPQGQQEQPAFAERSHAPSAAPHDERGNDPAVVEATGSRHAPLLDGRVDLYA